MLFHFIQQRRYARFERLSAQDGLVHAFATRPLNVAPRNGPDAEQRAANRAQMAADWGLQPAPLRYCQQVHQTTLLVVTESTAPGRLPPCDGAATNVPGLPLMSFSADCPLVLIFDPVQQTLGLVHASWRCTVARLVSQMVDLLGQRFGSRATDLVAGIGPGAGPCCYEVQDDVRAAATGLHRPERFFLQRDSRLYFDLWAANQAQLREAGVPESSIELAGVCTLCRNDLFYSFRREGQGCGHFGLLAAVAAD